MRILQVFGRHVDDERELGPCAVIGSVSFGEARSFQIKRNDGDMRETIRETKMSSSEVFEFSGWKDYFDFAVDKGLRKRNRG
jgi:alkylated DNA repair dioxygenase AlkB